MRSGLYAVVSQGSGVVRYVAYFCIVAAHQIEKVQCELLQGPDEQAVPGDDDGRWEDGEQ